MAADSVQRVPVSRIFSVFRRRKWAIIIIILTINAGTALLISQLKPYYDGSASVLIETGKSAFSDLQAAIGSVTTDTIALRTQADIIQSPAMALKVVDRLDLVHNPEFSEVINSTSSVDKAVRVVRTWLHAPPPEQQVLSETAQRQVAATLLQQKLVISNVGRSYVMEVRARASDAELSAAIANTYADFYVAFNKDMKQAAITRSSGLLDAQIAPLRDRAREAETEVEKFRELHGMMLSQAGGSTSEAGSSTIAAQQLSQVNARLSDAVANLAQKEAALSAVEASRKRGNGVYGIPEVIASPLIQRLREQEVQITAQVASINAVPGANNPLLRSTNFQLADIRRQINDEVAKIVDSLRSEVAAGRARRDSLQASLSELQDQVTKQNQNGIALKQLESEAEATRKVYRDYLGRFEQTSNQLAMQEPDASLVSAAQLPLFRAGPPRKTFGALGFIVSLVLAALGALLFDRLWGGAIYSSDQLESEVGLTSLGIIPNLRGRASGRRELRLRASRESLSLLHSILQRGTGRAATQVVMVTSALPGEGKTWFATSLASNAGRIGERVLLVDCDRHNPSVANVLGIAKPLQQTTDQNSPFVLRQEVLRGVDVVTLRAEAPEGWEGMRGLLQAAREHYKLIILDTPPMLMCADAASLASESNGVIMVVRWGSTQTSKVKAALQMLQAVGAQMLGGMLTQVRLEKLRGAESIDAASYGSYYRRRPYLDS